MKETSEVISINTSNTQVLTPKKTPNKDIQFVQTESPQSPQMPNLDMEAIKSIQINK